MLTIGIIIAAVGIVIFFTGVTLHATFVGSMASGNLESFDSSNVKGFRMVIGVILTMFGGMVTAIGGVLLLVAFIMWIVAQFA